MKRNLWKRLLSLALVFVLAVGLMPSITMEAKAAASTTIVYGDYTLTLTEYVCRSQQ